MNALKTHRLDFAPLLVALLLVASSSLSISAQEETDLPEELGTALGMYKLNVSSELAPGFEAFDYFLLRKFPGQDVHLPVQTESDTKVIIDGKLVTKGGAVFRFESASLTRRKTGEYEFIAFRTGRVGGVVFEFRGSFQENKVQEEAGGNYTVIRGQFTRYESGKRMRTQTLPFFQYAEL